MCSVGLQGRSSSTVTEVLHSLVQDFHKLQLQKTVHHPVECVMRLKQRDSHRQQKGTFRVKSPKSLRRAAPASAELPLLLLQMLPDASQCYCELPVAEHTTHELEVTKFSVGRGYSCSACITNTHTVDTCSNTFLLLPSMSEGQHASQRGSSVLSCVCPHTSQSVD